MSFFRLVGREIQGSVPRLAFMSVLGGVSNAAILATINAGGEGAHAGRTSIWSALLFILSLVLFIKTQSYVMITTTAEVERILHQIRVRLMDYVRRSELLQLESVGRSSIVVVITADTNTLTQASNMLAFAAQGSILVVFVGCYIAYLSLLAFFLSAITIAVSAMIFSLKHRRLSLETKQSSVWEGQFYERMMDILDGFKEVRLNTLRSDDLIAEIQEVSRRAANIKIRTQSETFRQLVFAQSSMYLLLGVVVFIAPTFSDYLEGSSISKITTALLYIVGTCFGIAQAIPMLNSADAAADRIETLEKALREIAHGGESESREAKREFTMIEMRGVEFEYIVKGSDHAFRVGPCSVTIRKGDLIFITGGNGSGKSTFMRLLAGLYKPADGEITLDGQVITSQNIDSYRSLFAAVLSDYHLFRRLYGIRDWDHAAIPQMLAEFGLQGKIALDDNEFDNLDLSAGQKKRLALIVSMLERRPILLLDEWTADQDSEFRRRFYSDILPELIDRGITVVAITHDERYLEDLKLPIRRLRMDEGRLIE